MLLASACAQAQTAQPPVMRLLESTAQAAFNSTRCPGLSVAVAQSNKIIYSRAFGLADERAKVRLRVASVHRLASLSKPITGTILMDLVQSGRLNLDAPIKTYLPDLPQTYDRVTVRQLLSHQAGVRDYRDLDEVFSLIHYSTSRQAIEPFVNDPLLFDPGSSMAYSTFGFTMAGAVAEAATGESFQNLARDFFHRYKISGFDLDDPRSTVHGLVLGYSVDAAGNVTNASAYDASNKFPGGGFTASAEDYLRFVFSVDSGKILRPEILDQMWTAQRTSAGTLTPFGLGWGVSERGGRKMVGFNGLQPSTTTSFAYFPSSGVGVVMLCNAEIAGPGGDDLGLDGPRDDLLKAIAPDLP
jgi:serine beta-lactamase-like protein LACTB